MIYYFQLDLADMASIRKFVEDFHQTEKKLNVLINNAGVFLPQKQWTKDNFEMMMGTNHLGKFNEATECFPTSQV